MTIAVSGKQTPPSSSLSASMPLLAFVLLALLIGAMGHTVFKQNEKVIRDRELENLGAIADLKAQQIASWREALQRQGKNLSRNTLLPALFEQWLRGGAASNGSRRQMLDMLVGLQQLYGYRNVALLDRQGATRLSLSEGGPLDEDARKLALDGMRDQRVLFCDFHRRGHGDRMVHMAFVAPLVASDGKSGHVVGAVVLEIDPAAFLYPLIQTWPTQSPSAETLLVRRDGGDVLFLNEVRHRKDSALSLRLPVTTARLPAAMAVRGQVGAVEGVDYRGVPVVAALRKVPGTSWFMVSKIDQEELFAPIKTLENWVTGMALALAAVGGILILLWYKRHQAHYRHLRAQHDAAVEREALVSRYETLTKCANDVIMVADETGKIVEANDRGVETYGYTREELLGMRISDFRLPTEDPAILGRQLGQIRACGSLRFETVNRRKDGTTFPIEASLRLIEVKGVKFILGIIRDISARKAAEQKILRLNALYAAISQTNAAILRIGDRDTLLAEICRIAVEQGRFKLAWIGLVDEAAGAVKVVASSGPAKGYADAIQVSARADDPRGRGPTSRALREGRVYVCNDFLADADTLPWQAQARHYGIRASAACPLKAGGQVVGALTVYAEEADYFNDELMDLLSHVSGDISFALDNFVREDRRRQAEDELRRQRAFIRQVIDTDPNLIFVKDAQGTFLLVNQAMAAAYGRTPEEMVGRRVGEVYRHTQEVECYVKSDQEVLETRQQVVTVSPFSLGGKERWFLTIKAPMEQPDGTVHVLGIAVDITERKAAEEKLGESYNKLQLMSAYLEVIREEEQKRIARELHDEMGGTLAALNMNVARLAAKIPADMTHFVTEVESMAKLVASGIQAMRHTVAKLRPAILDDAGLATAVEHHVQEFQKHTGIDCRLINAVTEVEPSLTRDRAATVFRILQESLTNVAKHAEATQVTVIMKEQGESLVLMVLDDGKGFDTKGCGGKSFGLRGIRERALMAGGKTRIRSATGKGTAVWVRVPMTLPALAREQAPATA